MIIKDFHDKPFEISEEDLTALIKGTFDDLNYAEYVGGTLTYDYEGRLLMFNLTDDTLPAEARYWLAKLYLKHKSPKHHHWKLANTIAQQFRMEVV